MLLAYNFQFNNNYLFQEHQEVREDQVAQVAQEDLAVQIILTDPQEANSIQDKSGRPAAQAVQDHLAAQEDQVGNTAKKSS